VEGVLYYGSVGASLFLLFRFLVGTPGRGWARAAIVLGVAWLATALVAGWGLEEHLERLRAAGNHAEELERTRVGMLIHAAIGLVALGAATAFLLSARAILRRARPTSPP
jgi:hypothetical protein